MIADETSRPFPDTRMKFLYPLAVFCGVLCGLLLVSTMDDKMFTALAVTVLCMAFGVARPMRPWRWLLLVGLPIPVTLIIGQMVEPTLYYTRATVAGSVLVMLPGFAGAYGGAFMRRVIRILFQEK